MSRKTVSRKEAEAYIAMSQGERRAAQRSSLGLDTVIVESRDSISARLSAAAAAQSTEAVSPPKEPPVTTPTPSADKLRRNEAARARYAAKRAALQTADAEFSPAPEADTLDFGPVVDEAGQPTEQTLAVMADGAAAPEPTDTPAPRIPGLISEGDFSAESPLGNAYATERLAKTALATAKAEVAKRERNLKWYAANKPHLADKHTGLLAEAQAEVTRLESLAAETAAQVEAMNETRRDAERAEWTAIGEAVAAKVALGERQPGAEGHGYMVWRNHETGLGATFDRAGRWTVGVVDADTATVEGFRFRFGFSAAVDAPRSRGWGDTEGFIPAKASWGSMQMDSPAENRRQIAVLTLAVDVAEAVNAAVGLAND